MLDPQAAAVRGTGQLISETVPGGAAIKKSVGQNGVNAADDTRAVQIALNAVPAALGGAGGTLDVDGKCGPLTIGAIATFQENWLTVHDARCDPLGPTLALLNAMAGVGDVIPAGSAKTASKFGDAPAVGALGHGEATGAKKPPAKPPVKPKPPKPISLEDQARVIVADNRQFVVERHHMPLIRRWLLITIRVLNACERHIRRLETITPGDKLPPNERNHPDRVAFLLLCKTFKLHEARLKEAKTHYRFIDNIFRQILHVVNTRMLPRTPELGPPTPFRAPLFVTLYDDPTGPHAGDLAYAYFGGAHLEPGPSGFFNKRVKPGLVVPERFERIYLLPKLFRKNNSNLERLTMIHEIAHFVGADSGPGVVGDATYIDRPKWRSLNASQRLHSADSYGFFATECNVGTFDAVPDAESNFHIVPINPHVETSFVFPEPKITLPPLHHTDSPKFDFPAGALF